MSIRNEPLLSVTIDSVLTALISVAYVGMLVIYGDIANRVASDIQPMVQPKSAVALSTPRAGAIIQSPLALLPDDRFSRLPDGQCPYIEVMSHLERINGIVWAVVPTGAGQSRYEGISHECALGFGQGFTRHPLGPTPTPTLAPTPAMIEQGITIVGPTGDHADFVRSLWAPYDGFCNPYIIHVGYDEVTNQFYGVRGNGDGYWIDHNCAVARGLNQQ